MQANPKYYYDEKTNSFCIENYQISKPFSSFLPGIAGIFGIPLWCFYVNRGQCIVSFGIKNKDGAILEFLPADRAYRLASTHGFRTFLKLNKNLFYEPFQTENLMSFAKSKMAVFADYIKICEENPSIGIKAEVKYYTLANKNVASLVRELKIINVSEKPMDIEVLDGLALIVPYGKNDFALKNMSRTAEAWNFVENLDKKAPYFRFHSSSEDTTEVVEIKEGNFFVSFDNTHGIFERCDIVIDPKIVFGISSELVKPYEFIFSDRLDISNQVFANKTCCAFAYTKRTLKPHDALSIYSIIGHAKSVDELNHLVDSIDSAEFFDRAFEENKAVINAIIEKNTIVTSDKKLDEYAKMCYLDNILRGGVPFTIEYDNKKKLIKVIITEDNDFSKLDFDLYYKFRKVIFEQIPFAKEEIFRLKKNEFFALAYVLIKYSPEPYRYLENLKQFFMVEHNKIKDEKNSNQDTSLFMTEDDVFELSLNENFLIGAHTETHRVLSVLDRREQEYEILQSKNVLQKITGREIFCFAYPFGLEGDFSEITQEICKKYFKYSFTGIKRVCSIFTPRHKIPRFYVPNCDGEVFERKIFEFLYYLFS